MKRKTKVDQMLSAAVMVNLTFLVKDKKFTFTPIEPISFESDQKSHTYQPHPSDMLLKLWGSSSKKVVDFKRAVNIMGLTASLKDRSNKM